VLYWVPVIAPGNGANLIYLHGIAGTAKTLDAGMSPAWQIG
jgi:hypothetical protein